MKARLNFEQGTMLEEALILLAEQKGYDFKNHSLTNNRINIDLEALIIELLQSHPEVIAMLDYMGK